MQCVVYRCSAVCVYMRLCVCLLDMTVNPTQKAEPIEVPFGVWNCVGPRNHVLPGARIPPQEGALFGVILRHAHAYARSRYCQPYSVATEAIRPLAVAICSVGYTAVKVCSQHRNCTLLN